MWLKIILGFSWGSPKTQVLACVSFLISCMSSHLHCAERAQVIFSNMWHCCSFDTGLCHHWPECTFPLCALLSFQSQARGPVLPATCQTAESPPRGLHTWSMFLWLYLSPCRLTLLILISLTEAPDLISTLVLQRGWYFSNLYIWKLRLRRLKQFALGHFVIFSCLSPLAFYCPHWTIIVTVLTFENSWIDRGRFNLKNVKKENRALLWN